MCRFDHSKAAAMTVDERRGELATLLARALGRLGRQASKSPEEVSQPVSKSLVPQTREPGATF